MSTIIKVHCLHHNRFWLAGSERVVSLVGSFTIIIANCSWFPVVWRSWKSHQNPSSLQKHNRFFPRKWMFCEWDVPIVPCVTFQNALFCGPDGLTFTWWGRCSLCFWHKPTELAHSFFFLLFLCLFLSLWPFQMCFIPSILPTTISAFSLCSFGLISALLVLLARYFFTKVPFSPDIILCGWLGLKQHELTN